FHMLKYGLAVVLIFVGLKMVWLNDLWGGTFPISLSLAIITAVIAISVVLSFVLPQGRTTPLPQYPGRAQPTPDAPPNVAIPQGHAADCLQRPRRRFR